MTPQLDRRTLLQQSFAATMVAAALPGQAVAMPAGDAGGAGAEDSASRISSNGSVIVPSFPLPASGHLSDASRGLFIEQGRQWEAIIADMTSKMRAGAPVTELRDSYSNMLQPTLEKQRRLYPGVRSEQRIAGVKVEIFDPEVREAGIVLINAHGGGFFVGAGVSAEIESLPVAAHARSRVVSVDYRMAPEHAYPAGSEDLIMVYRALLKDYPAACIGIFGSSAGALLVSQAVSQLRERDLPMPGAIGLFGQGGTRSMMGDSQRIFSAVEGLDFSDDVGAYMKTARPDDRHAFPAERKGNLEGFPPSLLISSTRDLGLSSVVTTHAELVASGVPADLHVWDGLRHCFYYDPDFEESRQAYGVIGGFFSKYLKQGNADNVTRSYSGRRRS